MKKQIMTYVVGVGLCIVVLSFVYYGSYQLSLEYLRKNEENTSLENQITGKNDDFTDELVEVDTGRIDRISEDTRCVLEIYDLQNRATKVQTASIKKPFYGFTREEVLLYLDAFVEEMPEKEKNRGMVSYELVSFGADEMVLRKSYDSNRVEYEFFMKAEGEEIIVYFSDLTRIYEYTGILTTNLSETEKDKLKKGYYVKDKEELYGILENYSS